MNFEPGKFLQNIELRLRGRTALLAIGLGVMVVAFWILMAHYAEHPLFSMIAGSGLLASILGFVGVGLLGKSRPEELPETSLTHLTQMGVVIAHGVGSHKNMVQLMRELSGAQRLPLPSHTVQGLAGNKADYVQLSKEESEKIVDGIEQGVRKLLEDAALGSTGDIPSLPESIPSLPQSAGEEPTGGIPGKKI